MMPAGAGLELGAAGALNVRHERVEAPGGGATVRLLYASDLHFWTRWTERAGGQLAALAEELAPDMVLLGGDLADSTAGLFRLTACVRRISSAAPVWAISGNHDRFPGVKAVRAAVEAGGGGWLGGRSVEVRRGPGRRVLVDGGLASSAIDLDAVRVLCAHDPEVFPAAVKAGYDVVLAGHLHGLQWVAAERGGLLYPGAWIWRFNGLRFHERATTMLVSRGVSDTVPIRWNCPREVLLCEIG